MARYILRNRLLSSVHSNISLLANTPYARPSATHLAAFKLAMKAAPSTCTSTFSGNSGCSGMVFTASSLLSNQAVVQLGVAVLVELRIVVQTTADAGGSSSAEFGESLDFPIGTALFNLPDGVTANAPDSFVFNDIFSPTSAVPLPAALPLFATGAGAFGLLGWRRRWRAAA